MRIQYFNRTKRKITVMRPKLLWLTCVSLLFSICLFAQKRKRGTNPNLVVYKYGDVKAEDFEPKFYDVDTSANAVILDAVGSTSFIGNNNGNFSIEYLEQKRVRLLKKTSFDREAQVEILLYHESGEEEKLVNFEAITYNVENGKLITTKLNRKDLFVEKYNDKYNLYKFTFPNLQEGSIIEYKYTTSSPFYFFLQPWNFQEDIPCLWSEYQATIPNSILDYVVIKKGFHPYILDTAVSATGSYTITSQNGSSASDVTNLSSSTVTGHWAMKDVPALRKEPFITSLENYRSKISFQLRKVKHGSGDEENVLGTWQQLAEKMLAREDFGAGLSKNNGWLNDDIKSVTRNTSSGVEKVKRIYEYVRDNYTCKTEGGLYLSSTLKKVYQDKAGNVADINLLLTAACRNAGFKASPVILSTRDNGLVNEIYPLIQQYNYVLCRVTVDDRDYLLDATHKYLGFGKLSPNVYNTSVRIIDTEPAALLMSSDSLNESKITSVFIVNEKDHKMSAAVNNICGFNESNQLREDLSKHSKDSYFKNIKSMYTGDVEISEEEIDSLRLLEDPVKVKYDVTLDLGDEDVIYFNPMIGSQEKDNPFTSSDRYYPVEMPFCKDETYVLNMEIPKGYEVDELPKSARVNLNEKEGIFEYLIAKSGDRIQLRSHVKLAKAIYEPEDYQTLRDFYSYIVKKQAEQVVFKKK